MDQMQSSPLAKVLIVEDEILVADDLRITLEDLGFEPVGIAPDKSTALSLAEAKPDIALVDLNLRDGATGVEIAERLAAEGVAVLFVTANTRSFGQGVPGAVGAVSKPLDVETAADVLGWICDRLRGRWSTPPAAVQTFA